MIFLRNASSLYAGVKNNFVFQYFSKERLLRARCEEQFLFYNCLKVAVRCIGRRGLMSHKH